jgi:hypothetical protein
MAAAMTATTTPRVGKPKYRRQVKAREEDPRGWTCSGDEM